MRTDFKIVKKLTDVCRIANVGEVLLLHSRQEDIHISIVKTAGKRFLPDFNRSENFSTRAHMSTPIFDFPDALELFINDNKCADLFCVILVDDYKYHVVTLPSEIDDNEIWLSENYSKFLPSNLSLDDFIFVFKDLSVTNDERVVELIMVRKDTLNAFTRAPEKYNLNILAVLPSVYFFESIFPVASGTPELLIELFAHKIQYLYRDDSRFLRNELHLLNSIDDENHELLYTELTSKLNDIKRIIGLSDDSESDNLSISILYPAENHQNVKSIVRSIFVKNESQQELVKYKEKLGLYEAIGNYLANPNTSLNLYTGWKLSAGRELLEKKFATNFFLAAGSLLLLLLLFLNIIFSVFSHLNDSITESLAEATELSRSVDLLKRENKLLEVETASLRNLQFHTDDITGIMYTLSAGINRECVLTLFSLKNEKERTYINSIKGIGFSQQAIAKFVSVLETSPGIIQTRLLGSTLLDENACQKYDDKFPNVTLPQFLYQFSIQFNYDPAHK